MTFARGFNFHPSKAQMRLVTRLVMRWATAFCASVVSARLRGAMLPAAAFAALLALSGLPAQAQFPDVLVFAAASLKNALDEANSLFLFENGSGVRVSYGASSALAKQIENGAPADVFISADNDWMDYLAERKLIKPDTREKFLGNKLVLVAPADSKVTLTIGPNFALAPALGNGRLAIADPAAVPAGKYGKAALEKLGVWSSVTGKLAPAQDVRAALLLVSRGEAPLGIVYQTDAAADKNVKVIATFPESSHPPIVYPLAILTGSTNGVTPVYVQYLQSPKAEPFFEKRGFTVF
jgi:molybdate transport system substrate-binding protein